MKKLIALSLFLSSSAVAGTHIVIPDRCNPVLYCIEIVDGKCLKAQIKFKKACEIQVTAPETVTVGIAE